MSDVVVIGRIGLPASARAQVGRGTPTPADPGPYGQAAAQAVAAARLGASVALIGARAADGSDQRALEMLQAAHVTLAIETQMQPATDLTARDEDRGAPGPSQLTAETLLRHAPLIARAKTLLLQHDIPLEVCIRAARIARSHGVAVILDPPLASQSTWSAQTRAAFDILTVTAQQAASITGRAIGSLQDAEICAEALTLTGSPGAIVTLGTKGAAWKIGASQGHRAAGGIEGADPSAGRDCFNATLAVFLAQGCTPKQSIEMAVDAARLAAVHGGTAPSFSDLLAFRAHRATSPRRPH